MCLYREEIVKTQRPRSSANELFEGFFFRKESDGSRNNRVPFGEVVRIPHHQIPTDLLLAQQEVKEVERQWDRTAKAAKCESH